MWLINMTIKAAIEYAIRSTEMENGPMSPESRALMQQIATGEIKTDQARNIIREKAQRLAKKNAYATRIVIYNPDGTLQTAREMTMEEIAAKQRKEQLMDEYLETRNSDILLKTSDR
jgi:tagatose-1,6-bisphosphate aldolase non-catalytic subunit AgaZ/GatZ